WANYSDLQPGEVSQAVECVVGGFRSWITQFRAHSQANLILHSLEKPIVPSSGVLDSQNPEGQVAAIEQINCALRRLVNEFSGVYVLDYDALVARFGRLSWHDEKKWLVARLPIAAAHVG